MLERFFLGNKLARAWPSGLMAKTSNRTVLSKIIEESVNHKFIAEILHHLSTDSKVHDRRKRDRVLSAVAELLRIRLEEEESREKLENFAGSGYSVDEFGDEELLNFFLRNEP